MPDLKLLDIYYGGQCNLACYHCDTRSDTFRKGELDLDIDTILQSIDLVRKKFKIRNYSLLGGEPFLNLDRVKIIAKYLRSLDKNCIITLPTNAMLLDKNIDEIAGIMSKYEIVLAISNHFAAFDTAQTNKIIKSANKLANKLGLIRRSYLDFYSEVLGDASIEVTCSDDKFWGDNKQGIYYHEQHTFYKNYTIKNGQPKPFAEGDPEASYKNGCCSPYCTFLYDKKIYKCASLGTLNKFLEHHNLLSDPAWQKYLNYQPLDLTDCTDIQAQEFSDSKLKAINECDMCSSKNTSYYEKTKETTLPKYKNYVPISRVD